MSRSLTECLNVFLSPFELVAVRRKGLARRIVGKQVHPVAAPEAGWDAAVRTFAGVLKECACRRARVILSCHLTRYQLIPWREDLADRDEEVAAARLALAETFGEAAAGWSIRLTDEPPGTPRVAAAVDVGLLDAMQQAASSAGTLLFSVQPYLAAAANSWRTHFGRGRSSWFFVHERHRACLALIERGRWHWLRCLRVGDDWPQRLPDLIEHEMLLAGVDAPLEVLVFAPGEPEISIPAGTRFPVRGLRLDAHSGFSPLDDGRFGLALVG